MKRARRIEIHVPHAQGGGQFVLQIAGDKAYQPF